MWLHSAHIGLLGTATGMVFQTSFITGIIQFKCLPRQMFGLLQSKQFPVYFALCAGTTAALTVTTASIAGLPLRDVLSLAYSLNADAIQVASLGVASVGALINLLIVGPQSSKIMFKRHKLEKAGEAVPASLNRAFGLLHSLSMVLNLVTFGTLVSNVIWTGSRWAAASSK